MSSGTLPHGSYHRAGSLGAGEEFALKSFDPDEDNDTLELGTLREVSILRILREANGHPNIVSLVDVQTEGEEEYSDGSFCMIMPLYSHGDLGSAIAKGLVKQGPAGRKQRVELAHGLLTAVAFLHDNHIIHRDIKSANVTISQMNEKIVPVLIDFSLAKFVDGENAVLPPGSTHTPSIGTPTYTAPEVVKREPYGLKSDCWSVGVVLLECLIGELNVDRDKAAFSLIEKEVASLTDSPFATLVRGLLEPDADKRSSAREALEMPIFSKFGLEVPAVKVVNIGRAFETDEDEESSGTADNKRKKQKNQKLTQRQKLINKLCSEIGCKNPRTRLAVEVYAKCAEETIDDELDDIKTSTTLLDCVIIANHFYEEAMINLEELVEDNGEDFPSFVDFDLETYKDNQSALFMSMDYCLYIR
ncbi:hypothetical protein THAOC_13092 [Thalassiosira oceanica]|uniref:Protein kinase domain-containing protein n=1 Tax=Thalassiosira oceanica TaxID=159749 RepID=K0SM15_THAOC|nr:hypothetical protein THAOC_13092 [Thalassiosira oceanica]|eukprot:EJK66014.1 hypothetical protein THAOC_13092 [Thalassiosira oceanica]